MIPAGIVLKNKVVQDIYSIDVDLRSIQQSIKNLDLTNDERIVVVDHNGTAIVNFSPSDAINENDSSSSKLENFSYLNGVKALKNGNADSISQIGWTDKWTP